MATVNEPGVRAAGPADPVMVDVGWIAGVLGCCLHQQRHFSKTSATGSKAIEMER